MKPQTVVIISKIPLSTVQSISRQLYPRLKLVLVIELPWPTANTNHVRKLITFSALMPYDIFFRDYSEWIQWILQSRSNTLILIHINKFLMVAKMKNYQNRKQQRVRMKVWAMASMQMYLSSFEMGLLFSLDSALYPLMKIMNIVRLTTPSQNRRKHVKKSQSQWKIVEQEWLGTSNCSIC